MEIICYLSNGYPTIQESYQMAFEYVDAGCDIIEIDFPARDPYLESEYISNRMSKALKICDDYHQYMDNVARMKHELKETKFIILVYEETIKEIGVEVFINYCLEHQFKDIILVSHEDASIKNELMEHGLLVSCYIQYQLLEDEINSAKMSIGFVYFQAKPTAGIVHERYKALKECIQYLRSYGITRPIYCGVGVHQPEDVKMVKEAGADAAFIGSAILKLQNDVEQMKNKIRMFKECSL